MNATQPPAEWISETRLRKLLRIGLARFRRIEGSLPVRKFAVPGCRTLYDRRDVEALVRASTERTAAAADPAR